MEKKIFKSGDKAPVSGNYQFVKHVQEVKDCIPRYGSYIHLIKGMKLPAHDECLQPCLWSLMTITEENFEQKHGARSDPINLHGKD